MDNIRELPPDVLENQRRLAQTFAKNNNIDDIETYTAGWLGGYHAALVEIGAINAGDTAAEFAFLKRLRGKSK